MPLGIFGHKTFKHKREANYFSGNYFSPKMLFARLRSKDFTRKSTNVNGFAKVICTNEQFSCCVCESLFWAEVLECLSIEII